MKCNFIIMFEKDLCLSITFIVRQLIRAILSFAQENPPIQKCCLLIESSQIVRSSSLNTIHFSLFNTLKNFLILTCLTDLHPFQMVDELLEE